MGPASESTLADIFRRERLSFLQYVSQGSPYAGPAERPILERIRELAQAENDALAAFADYLDQEHVSLPHAGAFPTMFTNYNFVDVKKLVKPLVADQARGLHELERDLANLPPGEGKMWVEKLASSKRLHLDELEKLTK